MEEFPKYDPRRPDQAGLNVPNKDEFLNQLSGLIRDQKSTELIGTFKAGAIPIILDTLARDTSPKGQKIVEAIYKIIEDVKQYYVDRETQDMVEVPVQKESEGSE